MIHMRLDVLNLIPPTYVYNIMHFYEIIVVTIHVQVTEQPTIKEIHLKVNSYTTNQNQMPMNNEVSQSEICKWCSLLHITPQSLLGNYHVPPSLCLVQGIDSLPTFGFVLKLYKCI